MTPVNHEAFREEIKTHEAGAGRYYVIYILLIILTFTTWGAAKVDLGEWNLVVALLIACTKASLVVLFFMHLWDSEGANRAVFVVSILFVCVMLFFILEDIHHRFPLANPRAETTVNLPGGNPMYHRERAGGLNVLAPGTAGHTAPENGSP